MVNPASGDEAMFHHQRLARPQAGAEQRCRLTKSVATLPGEARRSKAMVNPVLEDLPRACQHQQHSMVNRAAGPRGGRQRRDRRPALLESPR